MADQAYYSGDFYQCVTAAGISESPATAAAKWRKIQIPKRWRKTLAQLSYAHLLRLDGQTDKANIEEGRGRAMLDDLVFEEARQEQFNTCPGYKPPS